MVEMILLLFCIILYLVYRFGFSKGVKSVKTDLPEREQKLSEQQSSFSKYTNEVRHKLEDQQAKIGELELAMRKKKIDLEKAEKELSEKQSFFEKSKTETLHAIPWLANAFAELDAQKAIYVEKQLKEKSHPAYVAAEKVREAGLARREAIYQGQIYKLQIDYYLSLFPWLEDYLLLTPDEVVKTVKDSLYSSTQYSNEYDAVKRWLSPDEYRSLPNEKKWQLALDRYNSRPKTNWQLGIEYERYIGYIFEKKGYLVHYNGATRGVEDMGRDLIADNDCQRLVIQCKRWSKEKTIHEKHIFQLYGTCVLQKLELNTLKEVRGIFVTTTQLSPIARQCADLLNIEVRENIPLKPYPQIKCNIAKNGERIYHLPFDQQYDHTMLRPSDGDFYASTVQEAESKGFRRAFRWHGLPDRIIR